ncbi:MAG: hypothetical protein GY749_13410 [Desulfobacteraceae bacterium]|nr:hypothetical protein [Desulfobacteraceae bacterium]
MIFVFRRPGMQPMTHSLLLRIPLLKNVLTERFIVFFSEGMAILLRSGIPVSESLDILAGTAESNFGSVLKKAGAYAREGADFETILSSMKVFPNLYIDTCSGEKPDFLPDSLLALANIYKSEAEYNTRKFLYTLNAVTILMIGIWTGCLLTAMYLMSWRFTF